jgi:hypothetical protein
MRHGSDGSYGVAEGEGMAQVQPRIQGISGAIILIIFESKKSRSKPEK